MKLAICIPAYNEEKNIGHVLQTIPFHIPGIDQVKVFVIDDGSTDGTAKVSLETSKNWAQAGKHANALSLEITTIHPNKGLAHGFLKGIHQALNWQADFIVNIDADGQYRSEEIPLLLNSLISGEADMAIGDRQVQTLHFMHWAKRYGNLVGSWFLRRITGSEIQDASSGFRAYTRTAAQTIEVHSHHTYTHENLIQFHYQGFRIAQVPVTFIARTDGTASRLIAGTALAGVLKHIFKSLQGIFAARRRWRRK